MLKHDDSNAYTKPSDSSSSQDSPVETLTEVVSNISEKIKQWHASQMINGLELVEKNLATLREQYQKIKQGGSGDSSELSEITKALILENELHFIYRDANLSAYLRMFKRRISELMIASFAIRSGYVQVSHSVFATVIEWIAIAFSVFPPANLPADAVLTVIEYWDESIRKHMLKKINIFGSLTDAEKFSEQLGLLLLRARYHANEPLSEEQANNDVQLLINFLAANEEPLNTYDKKTLTFFLDAIINQPYTIEPIIPNSPINSECSPENSQDKSYTRIDSNSNQSFSDHSSSSGLSNFGIFSISSSEVVKPSSQEDAQSLSSSSINPALNTHQTTDCNQCCTIV